MKNSSARNAIDTLAPLMFLVLLCAGLEIAKPSFGQASNLLTMVSQSSVIIVIAMGQTLLMIAGGIDLSVGSVLALSAIVAGALHTMGVHPVIGMLAAVATATTCGLLNGVITTKAKMPPFIVTLGMMGIARGAALVISKAQPLLLPDMYRKLSEPWFFGAVVVCVGLVVYLILGRSAYGRHNYAVGGNKEASRLSGINVDTHLIKAFAMNGLIVGLASVLMMARLGVVASPTAGEGYELDSIAAAVIGGTSLMGGQGTVGGTIVGALIMTVLRNGCDLLNVDVNVQIMVIGAMIILAVFYDGLRRRARSKA